MKNLLKFTAMLLAVILVVPAFSGCSSKNFTVLEYKGVEITSDIYRYWLSSFKYYFVSQYEDITDTAECWNRDAGNGLTVGEYVEEYTLQYAKSVVCALSLFEKYKLKLDKTVEEGIDASINEIVRYQFNDSKAEFNAALMNTYGISAKNLRKAFILEAKVDTVESYLFGENGTQAPTGSEIDDFYTKYYLRVGVIMVNISFEYVLDEKGNYTYDDSGKIKIKEYTEEESGAKKKKAEEAFTKAQGGEEFFKLVSEFDDMKAKDAPNGFYFCPQDYESLVAKGYDGDILKEIMKLEENGVAKYPLDGGEVVVKRLPLLEKAYESAADKTKLEGLKNHLITEKYDTMLKDMWEDIKVDDYVYSLKTVDVKKGFI